MTKTEIRRYWKEHLRDGHDRLVDIECYTLCGEQRVTLIEISRNHVIWKHDYVVDGDRLRYRHTALLSPSV